MLLRAIDEAYATLDCILHMRGVDDGWMRYCKGKCVLCSFNHEMKDKGRRSLKRILVGLRRRRMFHRLFVSFSPFSLVGRVTWIYYESNNYSVSGSLRAL